MIELKKVSPASFQACIEMCRVASAMNDTVEATVLGVRVQAKPGDDPHELYKRWPLD